MAKHLGNRPQARLPKGSRRLAWGLGGAAVVTAAVVGIAQAVGASGSADLVAGTAGHADRPGGATQAAHQGGGRAHQKASPSAPTTRRADISRQAARRTPYHVQRGTSLVLKPAALLARKTAALSPATSTFTIAQSNILGSQHTAGSGGYGPGTYRAGITASLLTSRGVGVGGMQEVQADQLRVLQARMPGYSFWPAASLGNQGIRLQVYWRSDRFTMKDQGSVPYVFASQRIPLPYVLLRDNASGAEFWVITTHNSAGGMEAQRDAATVVEINLIHQLAATGKPVIITGDMNEHTEFFCKVAAATGMVAANGGSGAGGCHLPPAPLRVDWIMGRGVSFSGYRQDAAGMARASDHYYLYSSVTATSQWYAP
jgi:endonuclease/exonuclease/phosphatase family metal-dependent hydrolase